MPDPRGPLLAGVELGGTKCICILGSSPDDIRDQIELPTQDPATTLAAIDAVLEGWRSRGYGFAAVGLAAFGPLNLRPDSPRFGWVARTPKAGWSDIELAGRFARRFAVPVGIDTDVNAAARAEGRWGGAQGLRDFVYVTVGTGIGAGVIINGAPVSGAHHTELGHVRIVREAGDRFAGVCAFHGDCLEGLASGPSIRARTQCDPACLPVADPVWRSVAFALAQLCHILVLAAGPRRIFLGGGVMQGRPQLFPMIREALRASLNGYLDAVEVGEGLERFIGPPGLGTAVGPLGALAVAADRIAQV